MCEIQCGLTPLGVACMVTRYTQSSDTSAFRVFLSHNFTIRDAWSTNQSEQNWTTGLLSVMVSIGFTILLYTVLTIRCQSSQYFTLAVAVLHRPSCVYPHFAQQIIKVNLDASLLWLRCHDPYNLYEWKMHQAKNLTDRWTWITQFK